MKKFNCFLRLCVFIFSICFSRTSFADSDLKKIKFSDSADFVNIEDRILWAGYGFPEKFDSGSIKDEKAKKNALTKGLKLFENSAKKGTRDYQEILALYYFAEKEDFRKGVYWAMKCAEQGSSIGMHILAYAYLNGKGVIQDLDEFLKWTILGAAAGSEEAKKTLNILRLEREDFDNWDSVKASKQEAKDWAEKHPKAFFSPD